MGLLETLKKAGILRTYGDKGTYKNAKEMPDAFANPEANKSTDFVDDSNGSGDNGSED